MEVQQIGRAYYPAPWHYDKGEEVYATFRTDRDVLKSLLPSYLELPDGPAMASFTGIHHARSVFGPYVGVYLGTTAMHNGQPIGHMLSGMKTTFSGAMGGRESGAVFHVGEPTMEWHGDVLSVVAARYGQEFARMSVRLVHRKEPPETQHTTHLSIYERQSWDKAEKRNVLLTKKREPADPKDMVYWKAEAVLKLTGGEPGDDWSLLPVHEVVDVSYNYGGHSIVHESQYVEEF